MITQRSNFKQSRGTSSKQGSALIVSLMFTTILAVIAIPSYLNLSNQTLRQSNRIFYNTAAINLAESGVEYAVQAILQESEGSYDWTSWTINGSDALKIMDSITLMGNVQATTNVLIYDYLGESPEVVVKSTISPTSGSPIEKYMYASIAAISTRGLFSYGMLSKDFIQASGGVAFDSWNSDPDNDPSTAFVPYSNAVSNDNVAIGTTSTDEGAISLGSSDVYGTAAIGSADYSGLDVGWGGQVGPKDMNEWDSSDTDELWRKDGWLVSTQTGALTTGFTAEFEDVNAPDLTATDNRIDYILPYTDSRVVSNQWSSWTQNVYVDEETLGEAGTTTVLILDELEISGGATLRLEGDVIIHLPNEDQTTLGIIAGGGIEMADDASLTIYIAGDMEVSGAGILSGAAPKQVQIWGTASESQDIEFSGSGQFNGVIYAPKAEVLIVGGSDHYGSIVAENVELTGSGSFHYDEALASLSAGGGAGDSAGSTQVNFVEELVGDERSPYIDDLAF